MAKVWIPYGSMSLVVQPNHLSLVKLQWVILLKDLFPSEQNYKVMVEFSGLDPGV